MSLPPRPELSPGAAPLPDSALVSHLESFVRDEGGRSEVLPWVARLPARELGWLRGELSLLLSEPEVTGEPLDWRELQDLLSEFAAGAGWDGCVIEAPEPEPGEVAYAVELHPDDRETLA
ncbi:MAG: hypothetical protein K0Q72_2514, partial [Armatimonadetes bacterium]|nr:hypothetical protein [Armatimonadota bacterium]